MIKKVCIVTAARSEYGLLRWVIDEVYHSPELELQLVVTGGHLSAEQGYTYKEIEADGYPIDRKIDLHIDSSSKTAICDAMGLCLKEMAKLFEELNPDILVVLGDRYELLPICSAALICRVPIAHISGGDITIGAIDNEIRNAITMMSSIHFPGVKDSANNIIRMIGSSENVWAVGEPGLDNFRLSSLMTRMELSESLRIPIDNKWLLVTLHPETNESIEYNIKMAQNIISLLDELLGVSVIITKANTDFGGDMINAYWESQTRLFADKIIFISSLGQRRYISFMKECFAVIGNSSSGIVEAPHLGTPVINIGNRQSGRHLCKNVFQVSNELQEITQAWKEIDKNKIRIRDNYFGDGYASERIVLYLKDFLNEK